MKKLFKCTVCSFIWEGEQAPDVCPKCGQPHDKYVELSQEIIDKVYQSEKTNDIHMKIISLMNEAIELANKGVEINLDPPCVSGFNKTINECYIIKQIAKAEMENHIGKGKW